MSTALEQLTQQVVDGAADAARELVQQALEQGLAAEQVLNQALVPAMEQVGQLYEEGEFFLPEMMAAAQAMQRCMERLKPELLRGGQQPVGRAVIGTVQGDLHDIGKNLVATMLEGNGFEVRDLGADVACERFIEAAQQAAPCVLCLSALISTTMPAMATVVKALEQAGLRQQVGVLLGGAPLSAERAQALGADGYAADAAEAVRVARQLLPAAD